MKALAQYSLRQIPRIGSLFKWLPISTTRKTFGTRRYTRLVSILLFFDRAGRWRSEYVVDLNENQVSGKILLNVHYYEQGNVSTYLYPSVIY